VRVEMRSRISLLEFVFACGVGGKHTRIQACTRTRTSASERAYLGCRAHAAGAEAFLALQGNLHVWPPREGGNKGHVGEIIGFKV